MKFVRQLVSLQNARPNLTNTDGFQCSRYVIIYSSAPNEQVNRRPCHFEPPFRNMLVHTPSVLLRMIIYILPSFKMAYQIKMEIS